MTAIFDHPREFAVLCDGEGNVRQIIHDSLGIRGYLQPGESWTKILNGGSSQKAFAFLTTIGLRGRAVGWEFNVDLRDRIELLNFVGSKLQDGLLVVGAADADASLSRSKAIVETNQATSADRPAWLFDEITRINNELINVKRELDKKNRQLTQLTAELEKRVEERTAELEASNHRLQQSIIERVRAEENASHNERLAAVGTMVAKIAHELANPLNAIYASIELAGLTLEEPQVPRDSLAALIADVKEEFNRLKSLLEELRSSTSRRKLRLKPIDLQALTEKFLSIQAIEYQYRRIKVVQEFESDLPEIMADAEALTQVLLNLCKNSVEAMPEGGTLILRGSRSRDRVLLEVIDSGGGISQEVDVFKPFNTTKARGMGVGLAIVGEIVAGHKGTIAHTSEQGRGTTFCVSLPMANK